MAETVELLITNIKQLKALRGYSDQDLAERGRYNTRQAINHKLTGRAAPTIEDLVRVAAALRVEPSVLLQPTPKVIEWVQAHPHYKPVPPLPPRHDSNA